MNQALPVTIITGFLGAGKTTLLVNLLKKEKETHFAILVNEFGEVSIDSALIKASAKEAEIHDLPNGLVAYSPEDSFVSTMNVLAKRKHSIDHILVETSGLALPTAVMERLRSAELKDHFIIDATLVVVDTPLLLTGVFDANDVSSRLFVQQMESADVVVLNKIDDISEESLLQAESKIRSLAPSVRFIEPAFNAQLDPRTTLGLKLNQAVHGAHKHLALAGAGHADGHVHSGLEPHEHGISTHEHVHEHDPGWLSFVLRSPSYQKEEKLAAAVKKAALQEPLLRVKGFAHVEGSSEHLLLQAVRDRVVTSWSADYGHDHEHHDHEHEHHDHDHHDHTHHDHNHKHEDHDHEHAMAELVFIGYHIDRENIKVLMNEITKTSWD